MQGTKILSTLGFQRRATARGTLHKFFSKLFAPTRTRLPRPAHRLAPCLVAEPLERRTLLSATAEFAVVNDWGNGFQGEIDLTNADTAVSSWRLEFDFNHQITQIWNARIESQTGSHYVVTNAPWNGSLGAGASVTFGFLGTPGNVTTEPTGYTLNGVPLGEEVDLPELTIADAALAEGNSGSANMLFTVTLSEAAASSVTVAYATSNGTAQAGSDYTATSGVLTFAPGQNSRTIPVAVRGDLLDEAIEDLFLTLSSPAGATLADGSARGRILDDDAAPAISIGDVSVAEPDSGTSVADGYFSTQGSQILDAAGQPVRIAGVNWFGMESDTFAPHGLWTRNYMSMMDQMVDEGFNTIRLPFSNQLFDAGSTPNGIDFFQNPDLQGLSPLGILDKIVDYAGEVGLRIIFDHHRSNAGAGAEGSGLWYTGAYPESRWISDWVMLAERYAGNPTVIGADLHNEPHGPATWGGGGTNDWRLAAERAGNAILAVNSDWLIVVEGVEVGSSGYYWWGGNLSNAGDHPVRLNVDGRLVYSPHDYPASVFPQPWFSEPDYPSNLTEVWDANWGYLFQQDIAPIMLGEFGSRLATESDRIWLEEIVDYLGGDFDGDGTSDLAPGELGPSWTYWSWNPNSSDTGGILQDDWDNVHRDKVDALAEVQFAFPAGEAAGRANATLTVSLSAASGQTVTVAYTTANGTATAGSDYTATSGTLTFAPGQTQRTIDVPILADSAGEASETLLVRLSSASLATIADGEAVVTITDSTSEPELPALSVGDVAVTEGNAGTSNAVFTVSLSAAADAPVTVAYSTTGVSATAGSDFVATSGVLTFAPGVTALPVTVPIVGDTNPESSETFRLTLASPSGATLGRAFGIGTIADNDAPTSGLAFAFNVSDDWGSGFVAGVTITNHGSTAVNGWTLEFDFDRDITNIWNAEIVSRVGNRYVIQAASWNRVIPAGGSISFGFQGASGNVDEGPTNLVLNGVAL